MNTYAMEEDRATAGGGMGATLSQLPIILMERKWLIIVPAVLGLLAAVATALLLPKRYESTAILLVQAPSLPREVIGMPADEAVTQRIEAIRQQLINRPALIGLIERNGLYESERDRTPLSRIVENMRESITLVPQTIDLGPTNSLDQTISVRLAYIYDDPVKAQAVTQQLMERVVEVDSTTNAEQQTETVQFLSDQQQDLQRKIVEAEGALAAFNARYGGVMASGTMATIGGSGGAYDLQISNLERDIAELESQKRLLQSADTRDPAVVQAEAALAGARARYAETHPDVILARQRLEQAKQFALQNVARIPGSEIDDRIRIARSQIVQFQAAKQRESAQTAAVLSQRAMAPGVQQEAAQLQQRINLLYKQAEEVSGRLLSARASARANEEQMGERLLVVDPPVIPDTPTSPNRPLIIGLGLVGGLGLGFVLALGMEFLLRPIRHPGALANITGSPPLAMIPTLASRERNRRKLFGWRRKRKQARLSRRKRGSGET